jgi:hypothetical protein
MSGAEASTSNAATHHHFVLAEESGVLPSWMASAANEWPINEDIGMLIARAT